MRRRHSLLAWTLCGVSIGGLVVVAVVGVMTRGLADQIVVAIVGMFITACAIVGALVASRHPTNPIGWMFCGVGVFAVTAAVVTMVTALAPAQTGVDGRIVDWIGSFIWTLAFAPMIFVLQLFPSGRPLSRRWLPLVWMTGLGIGFVVVAYSLAPGPLENSDHRALNPFGVEFLRVPLRGLLWFGSVLIVAAIPLSLLSLLLRFRRSAAAERQQLKWFAFAGLILAAGILTQLVVFALVGEGETTVELMNALFTACVTSIPVAIGIAILRYRLYDIDRIINRTLVYGLLTAALIGGYVGGVLLVQSILPVASDSPVVVAVSTLAMAALFSPLRRGIQATVDRRFYRRKYDAVQTLEDFSARLRDETDLEVLTQDLVGVVKTTMQPTRVSLWLRTQKVER